MIITIVGTHHQQFNRLLKEVETLPGEKLVQYGHSTYQPAGSKNVAFLPFEETRAAIEQAEVVITHAGTGTVMMALSLGKRPVVAPRYKKFDEHVDDHQLELVATLKAADLIEPWMPGEDLSAAVARAKTGQGQVLRPPSPNLVNFLKRKIEE